MSSVSCVSLASSCPRCITYNNTLLSLINVLMTEIIIVSFTSSSHLLYINPCPRRFHPPLPHSHGWIVTHHDFHHDFHQHDQPASRHWLRLGAPTHQGEVFTPGQVWQGAISTVLIILTIFIITLVIKLKSTLLTITLTCPLFEDRVLAVLFIWTIILSLTILIILVTLVILLTCLIPVWGQDAGHPLQHLNLINYLDLLFYHLGHVDHQVDHPVHHPANLPHPCLRTGCLRSAFFIPLDFTPGTSWTTNIKVWTEYYQIPLDFIRLNDNFAETGKCFNKYFNKCFIKYFNKYSTNI